MTTLYLVSNGDYSDYHILGIYSTAEKAELSKKLHAAENDIEQMELDAIPQTPNGMFYFSVSIDKDGNSSHPVNQGVERERYTHSREQPDGDGIRVIFYMWARDAEHAIKIANERRLMLLANGTWNTDYSKWSKLYYGRDYDRMARSE